MELRQIRYFIEVANREHMTDAANALHVAQSAVSRQIVNLEDELGVDLFIREGRNLKLTPIGRTFLERISHAVNVIDGATQEVSEYLEPEKGTVRIAYPISLAAHTLPRAISSFRMRYPDAKFQLMQRLNRDLVSGIVKGDFNMAMIGPLPKDDRRIETRALFTEKVVALLPKHHRLADRENIRLRDLKDEPFVLLPEPFEFRNIVLDACKEVGFTPYIAFEGDDIDALKGLVAAGLGVTLMPEVTLMDSLFRSTVKKNITDPDVTRTVGVLSPVDRQLLPTEKLFYDFIVEFFDRVSEFKD
ncbi:LysR substrate-binding domain-containing protein [Salisediminibacterium beveridgei]|uniref:HTH-type transcriptional regulator gltC n=1 Tax=Salisediminibacterium beveridgei TaxID=632773 RepID=A0A1D7QVA9_9BACI|nr:LysR substrate-binding domain-containing protein [Salisediminibacterium beveridgei]AOM82898.1 HTH-type transcriptional regulator gltC [Salisediminibacterium beveridgei]